jgi:hypothetical protein
MSGAEALPPAGAAAHEKSEEGAAAPRAPLFDGRTSLTERFGLSVPRCGLSLRAIRAFAAAHAGTLCAPAADEDSSAAALPFDELTTAQVVQRVIKPATAHTGGSYAELLLQQARDAAGGPCRAVLCMFVCGMYTLTSHFSRASLQDARDEAGRPLVAAANVFVSHAWAYPFSDLVAALTARFEHDEHADALFLWNGATHARLRESIRTCA